MTITIQRCMFVAAALLLSACGGGSDPTPPAPATYTVGGSVSGLNGTGLVLQNNGGNSLAVTGNGNFSFSTALAIGSAYAVTVSGQPGSPAQTCSVSSGSGTVAAANVSSVVVACTTNTYAVGGTLSGLSSAGTGLGAGLLLQNNGGASFSVSANGNFVFPTAIASGASYNVTVANHPYGQLCTITAGSGTVTNAAVSSVAVSCRAAVGKFLYVSNQTSNTVSVYSINAATGALTQVGSPVPADRTPTFGLADPTEKFFYVANKGDVSNPPRISAYTINGATGALTPVAGSPFVLSVAAPLPNGPADLGQPFIHPSGKFAYIIDRDNNQIYGATIDATTGALAELPGLPAIAPASGYGIFSTAGDLFYMPSNNATVAPNGVINVFQVNAVTGMLTLGTQLLTGGAGPQFAEREPARKFLLTGNIRGPGGTGNGSVSVFSIDPLSGALAAAPGSPFAVGGSVSVVGLHPTKNFYYAVMTGFGVNAQLVVLSMNAVGTLTQVGLSVPLVGAIPGFAIVDPSGKFLVISSSSSGSPAHIQSFSINQTDGSLTEVAGSPFVAGVQPVSLLADYSFKYLYAVNGGSASISSYAFDATTGSITLVNTLPTGTNPYFPTLFGRQ